MDKENIISLKYVNKSNNFEPSFADEGSSGFDLRAWITPDNGGSVVKRTNEETQKEYETCCVVLKPLERKMILLKQT